MYQHKPIYHPANLQLLKELQFEYPEGNPIRDLIGELVKDVEARAPRKEIRADALAIQKELGKHPRPGVAYRAISLYLGMRKKRK